MIKLEVNGVPHSIEPASIDELRNNLTSATPEGEVRCQLRVNGMEIAETRLDDFSIESILSIETTTARPSDLARQSVSDTADWIARICDVLSSVAEDYRLGRSHDAASRLVSVIDALQVLTGLLKGIHDFIPVDPTDRSEIEQSWKVAEEDLKRSISGLVEDIESGDPIRLADRTGHTLPRSLHSCREMLSRLPA